MMTILDAITNPKLFLPLFRDLETWSTWIVVLKAVFCLTMTSEELEVYRKAHRQGDAAREANQRALDHERPEGRVLENDVIHRRLLGSFL